MTLYFTVCACARVGVGMGRCIFRNANQFVDLFLIIFGFLENLKIFSFSNHSKHCRVSHSDIFVTPVVLYYLPNNTVIIRKLMMILMANENGCV
jgi:hypothetical protein